MIVDSLRGASARRVRRTRPANGHRAIKRLLQPEKRDAPRYAFQTAPKAEAKLVRCSRGAIYDVIIDLQPESATYCSWNAIDLTADNNRMLYIPEGFAHGFQTLMDDTEVFYQMFEFYSPEHAGGVRWDDPAFGITWPLPDPTISERDKSYPSYRRITG